MVRKSLATVFALLLSAPAAADDLFRVTATVNSVTNSASFDAAEDTFDSLKESELAALVPTYTGSEVASVGIDFRGLALTAEYPVASAPQLVLTIPRLGIVQTFTGATREESRDQLRDFFKDGDLLGRIMRELARVSPVDPIAGNPASLQSRLVGNSFDRNFRRHVSRIKSARDRRALAMEPVRVAANAQGDTRTDLGPGAAMRSASIDLGASVHAYRQSGLDTVGLSLPLGYAFPPDPGRPFSINADLHVVDTEGAETYGADLGAAYRFDINPRWSLAPSLNVGGTASEDLGSVGYMGSAALTSTYLLHDGRYSLWMGNAINYSRSLHTSIGGFSYDAKIENVVFVNGLLLSTPMPALGANYSVEYSLTDFRFTGTELYNDYYDEIGVALGRSWHSGGVENHLRVGLNYLSSENSHGFSLNLDYSF